MARGRWEPTALLALLLHNNGLNKPLRDVRLFNPYREQTAAAPPRKVRMTLVQLQPLLERVAGSK